tara:strand:+ start:1297 stop:1959 length:663 start_codon:yes stop_codon:yes gene_type:complete
MARKTLLTEAEIRSFMKLANLEPIGHARLNEWTPSIEEEEIPIPDEEEDELDPDAAPAPDDMEMDAELGAVDDMEMDAEMGPEDDMAMGADMGDVGMGGDKEDQFKDLVQQLADLVGIDVQMDDGDAMADAEMEMDDDADSLEGGDELGDEAPPEDLGDDVLGMSDEEDEDPAARYMEGDTEKVVNEVARRVASRLANHSKKQRVADELTERIYNRLTNK